MSKNIFVMYRNSSRIIPGRSILNNSNHQSSNIEGKKSLHPSLLPLSFSLSPRRDTRTHTCIVHVYLPGIVSDPNSTTNSPAQTLLFQTSSRVSTQAEVLGALLPVYVPLFHQFHFLYHPARRRFLPSPKVDTFYSTRVFFSKVSRFTTIGWVIVREDNDVVL